MRVLIAYAVAPLLVAPVAAQAEEPRGITYDCDTAANHYSELSMPAGPGGFTVTGKVQLLTVIPSRDFITLTRLSISDASPNPGPSDKGWAGFEIGVLKQSARQSGVALISSSLRPEGGDNATEAMGIPVVIDEPGDLPAMSFKLTYDGKQVVIQLGEKETALDFAASQPIVRVVCSTGEFLYTDLVISPGG